MARPGVTKDQIREAISVMEAEGEDITVTAVRDKLGRGSYTTIGKTLSQWREEQAKLAPAAIPEMPERLGFLTTQVWKEAYQAADAVHQVERDAFEKRQREFEQQKAEMLREIERLEQSHLETQAELKECRQTLTDCQQEQTGLTATNAALERDVESLRDKNEELTANLEQTKDALRLAEAQRDTAEKRSQQLETENQVAKEQLQELTGLTSQVEGITEERDRLRQEVRRNQDKLTAWIERAARAETQLQTPKRKESAGD